MSRINLGHVVGVEGSAVYYSRMSWSEFDDYIDKSFIRVPDGHSIKLRDLILDPSGHVFQIIDVEQSRVKVTYLFSIKGATGPQGPAGTWEGIVDSELSTTSTNPVENRAIGEIVPAQASASNKLADKNFVNSSIGTNTANYISNAGQPFTSLAQLQAYSGTVTNNDYAFVTGTDSAGNTYFDRYKATVNGSSVSWAKEYRLNNSSFTAEQWAAISSGITAAKVAEIDGKEPAITKLPITKGGTGATTAKEAEFNIHNGIELVESNMNDSASVIMRYGTPSATQGTFFYRTGANIWNWIKSKLATVATSGKVDDLETIYSIGSANNGYFKIATILNATGEAEIKGFTINGFINTWENKPSDHDSIALRIPLKIGITSRYGKVWLRGVVEGDLRQADILIYKNSNNNFDVYFYGTTYNALRALISKANNNNVTIVTDSTMATPTGTLVTSLTEEIENGNVINVYDEHSLLENKVDKVTGKGLSTNDYTTTEKTKLAGIESGANKTTVDSSVSSTSTNPLQNKVVNSSFMRKFNPTTMEDLGFTAGSTVDVATFLEKIRTTYGSRCVVDFGWAEAKGAKLTDGTNTTDTISGYTLFLGLNNVNTESGTWQCSGGLLVPVAGRKNTYVISCTISATAGTISNKTIVRLSNAGHEHSASEITSGTLPLARGGTNATTAKSAQYQILNDMNEATTALDDNTQVAYKYVTPSSSNGSLYFRKASYLWNYIKSKLATVATSGSYNDLTNKPTIPAAQVQTDWNATSGMGVLKNKPSTFPPSSHAHTKSQVGLEYVDNTSDANKPISTATQTELNNKMDKNNPVGTGSLSIGRLEGSVLGDSSSAVGVGVTASGDYSHAEGFGTTASGDYSHAEGFGTTANGDYSHAEGLNTVARGHYSHAEGRNTVAIGDYSHAEGLNTVASGDYSHAEGYNTVARVGWSHVQGQYNVEDNNNNYADIIGNGTESSRKNIEATTWTGDKRIKGDLYTGCNDDSSGGTSLTVRLSSKADKSSTVSNVAYDSTNKKLTKTINGTTSDIVTASTLKTAMSLNNVGNFKAVSTVASQGLTDTEKTNALNNIGLSNIIKVKHFTTANTQKDVYDFIKGVVTSSNKWLSCVGNYVNDICSMYVTASSIVFQNNNSQSVTFTSSSTKLTTSFNILFLNPN